MVTLRFFQFYSSFFLNLTGPNWMQYFKDRTECFDDYYPCTKNSIKCDLSHGDNWIKLFIYLHNTKIRKTIIFNIACEIALT